MRYLLIVLSVFLSSQAFADSYEIASAKQQMCMNMAGFAETAMTARQLGVSIDEIKEKTSEPNKDTDGVVYDIIDVAYTAPIYPTAERKIIELEDFKQATYLSCLDNFF